MELFEKYKSINEIADLINEIQELRWYFSAQQYDKMQEHIQKLTHKYLMETLTWNSVNQAMPSTVQQAYINAESFLRLKGFSVLINNGINAQDQLSSAEIDYLRLTFRSMDK